MEPARTIDEVIAQLTRIVDLSCARGTADGYFAGFYRRVAAEVRARIARGWFDDGPRLERLDVRFANRYLQAWARHETGERAGAAWDLALGARHAFWPVVLQHLLLGINAHINLDLGLAAAATAPGTAIEGLKADFDRINRLLGDLVNDVEKRLVRVWPPLRRLEGIGGGADVPVANFSLRRARDHSWSVALAAAAETDPDLRAARAEAADLRAAAIGQRILHPGFHAGLILKVERLSERGSIAGKLAVISAYTSR